jgi:nucleoside-diphosphate-sugar epimerase
MRVLVTGASGFLGSHIAEQLAREGHAVRVLVRRTSDRSFLRGFETEEALGDVTQPESLPAAVAGMDAVVHAAGLVKARSAAEFQSVNAGGTANLLSALNGAAGLRRFVLISSLSAHGPSPDGRPRHPDDPPAPVSDYGRSKLLAEEFVRSWAGEERPATIIRPPVIYGPRDRATLPLFQAVRRRLAPLLGDGTNGISCVYAEDAARAAAMAATAGDDAPSATYSLDDGSVYTWRDFLAAIEQAVGRKALRLPSPHWAFAAAALVSESYGRLFRRAVSFNRDKYIEMRQRYWVCSHEEIARDLGWEPQVTLGEGTALTAAWYRREGWL